MRIGFQLLSLRPGQVGGQEVLVRRLLTQIVPQLRDDRLVVFARPQFIVHPDVDFLTRERRVELVSVDPEPYYGDDYEEWNLQLLDDARLDVVCFPLSFFFPRPLHIPVVVHIPDIQHEFYPEYFSAEQLAWRRDRIAPSALMADAVVTYSEASARSFRERLFVPREALHVIPSGGFTPEELASRRGDWQPESAASTRLLPEAPFVLYPAADWPHKNHETLLRAMALLARAGRPEHLVLTGMLSQRRDALLALAQELGISDRTHMLGCVRRRDLIDLYASAAALACPSRFEGFGQPLIEAMQLGCPIVASRASAVLETAGDAAVFAEDDPTDWAGRLLTVLANPTLQDDLARRGYLRAMGFDWESCAIRHLDLLRAVGRRGIVRDPAVARAR